MLRNFLVFVLLFSTLAVANAGPDHDHGDGGRDDPSASRPATAPRLESVGSDVELVAVAEGQRLTIYLDRVATNEPVDDASIEVSGEGIQPMVASRVSAGTYAIEADWVETTGTKALVFTVSAGGMMDLLNGTLIVPDAPAHEDGRAVALSELLAMPQVAGLFAGGVALGFVLALSFRRRKPSTALQQPSRQENVRTPVPRRSAAEVIVISVAAAGLVLSQSAWADPGHDHGDGGHDAVPAQSSNAPRKLPDGSVFVPKATQRLLQVRTMPAKHEMAAKTRELIGTVVSDPSAFGQVQAPMDGKMELGERGISFVGQKVQAGEVLALLSPTIPVADLGTMQQLRAEVDGKLALAEQKLARLTRIPDAIPRRDIEDTEAELVALREQKRVLAPKGIEKVQLTAPVGGVISVANVRAGQVVNARDTLFEIVDPERLWVEGTAPDVHGDGDIAAAYALDAEGHAITLSYVGRSPTLRQQSRPYLFRIDDIHSGLAIGSPVRILAQSQAQTDGFILPSDSVVRGSNGLAQVWVKVAPERFRPAIVESLQIDGTRILARAGIEPGDRVVTSGAELINQIR